MPYKLNPFTGQLDFYEDASATTDASDLISGTLANARLSADVLLDATLKGGAVSTASRLGVLSNFTSPNAGGYVINNFYDNAFAGTTATTAAMAANRAELAPFYTNARLTIDQIGIAVSTAVAASLAKIVIYSTSSGGWPDVLLFEGTDLDCATTGYKFTDPAFTFESGVQYWIGVRSSSTQTIRTINTSSARNLGISGSNNTTYYTVLRRTITYADAAPDPWVFASGELTAGATPPSIRFRVSAVG